jgi:polysaccharide pyruvyl transferase WcaK-like protein
MLLATSYSRRTAFFGVEIGPIPDASALRVVRAAVERASLVAVRTEESADWLRGLLPGRDVTVIPDVALGESATAPAQTPQGCVATDHAAIVLHVGSANLWRKNPTIHATLSMLERLGPVSLVSDTSRLSRATEQVLPKVGVDSRFDRRYRGFIDLMRVIAASQLVVTTKLHVEICAYGLGVPVVQFAQHQKTGHFNSATKSIGQSFAPLSEYVPADLASHIARATATAGSGECSADPVNQKRALTAAFDRVGEALDR